MHVTGDESKRSRFLLLAKKGPGPSRPEQRNRLFAGRFLLLQLDALVHRFGILAPIENDKNARVELEFVEVSIDLFEPDIERIFLLFAPNLEFDGFALDDALAVGILVGKPHEQIHAPSTHAVFAIDEPAAIDDALQESHENDLSCRFIVGNALGQNVGMLHPKGDEFVEQHLHIKAPVGQNERMRLDENNIFGGFGQDANDDFFVNGIGDAERAFRSDQSQIATIGDVVVVGCIGGDFCFGSDDGFEHPFDPRFHEASNKGIQVGRPGQNQTFFGFFDVVDGNGFGRRNFCFFNDFASQCIDEPRLTSGQFNGPGDGFGGKHLARFGRVLSI